MIDPPIASLVDLTGKVALVTGAGSGFGAACAKRLAEAGASLMLVDVGIDGLQRTQSALVANGYTADFCTADITDENAVDRAIAQAEAGFGRLDIAVNSAGVFSNYLLDTMTLEEFRRVMDVNVTGTFLVARTAARAMRRTGDGGSIINISSIDAIRPSAPGLGHYDASKHGVWGLTKSAALEMGPDGIRVNAIAPGSAITEGVRAMLEAGAPEGHDIESQFSSVAEKTPLGRLCTPDDVARVAVFLASDLSSFVTGAQLVVDGGFIVQA